MVERIEVYKCICGRIYLDIKEAEKCEAQKVIDPFDIKDVLKFKCQLMSVNDFYLYKGILKITDKLKLTNKHEMMYNIVGICYNSQFEENQRSCEFIQAELTTKNLQNSEICLSFGFSNNFKILKKGELEIILEENPEVKEMWEERIEP